MPQTVRMKRRLPMNLQDAKRLLAEAEETIEAIRSGKVDAIVVNGEKGDQVYTLQGAERPYRMLVETMSEGALTVNNKGIILFSNSRFASLVNRPLDSVIGLSLEEFIDPAHIDRFHAFFKRALTGIATDDFFLTSHTRPPLPAHFSSAIVETDNENDICIVITDLSEYKKNQAALRRKDEALKEKFRQEREIQTLLQLTTGVAHEIRNPLHAILSISEALIQELGDKQPFLEYKKHIQAQANRLNDLLIDLLEYGKPIQESQFSSIPLIDLLREAVDTWKNTGKGPQPVRIVAELLAKAVTIRGNRDKLQQVVFLLLENASQHSPLESKITLRVFAPRQKTVSFSVADRGGGIKPEHLNRIFEPFFTTRKSGTGLGLPIARHILSLHGGSIRVNNNTRGPGITVCVTLPVARQ